MNIDADIRSMWWGKGGEVGRRGGHIVNWR